MTANEFTAELIRHGAQLRADGDQLTIRAPKGAVLPERDRLAEHKAGILALLRGLSTGPVSLNPLSYGQKSLWFVYQLAPYSVAYNVVYAARIASEVSVAALKDAFKAVIDRHPCLRTTYTAISGEPAQAVNDFGKLSFDVIQALNWSMEEVRDQMDKEADRPFDLERGPVLRAHLFVRSTNENFLLITAHHIAVDAISIDVLTHDLCKFYNREALRPLFSQYSDYVRWQVEMLAGSRSVQLWGYWQKQLSGDLPALNLPTDRPRPAVQTYRGATHSFVLNADLTRSLKEVAKENHTTLYMTVLAAFQMLLHRYTGQEDISIGSPMAGRSQADFSGIVGYFVNPVVIRANLSGNPTFKVFLAQARQTVLDALEHGDYPFPLLVERLHPDRDSSRSPIFQSAFVWSNYRQKPGMQEVPSFKSNQTTPQIGSPKLELEPIGAGQQGSEFDLVLTIFEGEKSLAVQWRYNTDLFNAATIVRMTDHIETLLEEIVANPEQKISVIPMMTTTERHQLLVEWNDSKSDYRKEGSLHELIEEQVEKTPDSVAVVFEGKQLTYRELNARANQLAHYLRNRGVGPEVLVGICTERSLEMVIGLLGILKAGGAYVPLDPAYPQDRLEFMLGDSQVGELLTEEKFLSKFHYQNLVCLNRDWKKIAQESEENLNSGVTAKNLAYVIYTSGSTGTPKGVEIEHGGLNNLIAWHQSVYGVTAADRATQLASPAFDACSWELWPYLTAGASIHIPNEETLLFPAKLLDWLAAESITICFLPTPLAEAVLEEPMPAGLALRTLLTGGDKLRRLPQQALPFRLANNYGPTENTVVTTWCIVSTPMTNDIPPPIGRPIANTKVYVLDPHLNPVPVGISGELYIGGAGLARGYLNRPALTQEKFIPDTFSDEAGSRLYKTGDSVRYRSDGSIEFLGRLDHQVKVRGFRIEVGEIESVLSQYSHVKEAVVVAREDVPGEKRLVGYVVASRELTPTTSELRNLLQQKLPDYMVPGVFVFLEALPLTPNQKIDRRALPAPDTARPELGSVFVGPESGVEKTLAEIWSGVLGVERVGIYDNFFDLGGHSLLMAKAHGQLIEALGRDIPMVEMFRYPTISALAEHLNDASGQRSLQPISSRAEKQRLALQHQQQRMQAIARLRGTGRQGS